MSSRSNMRGVRLWLAGGVILLLGLPLLAQEKPEPPKREGMPVDSLEAPEENTLPPIDLPEFQITGQERVDLPAFSKTAAEDDGGLSPLLDDRGPGQREAPEIQFGNRIKEGLGFDTVPRGFNGRLAAGYGSFTTPFFDGWFGRSATDVDFLLKAGYTSSEGHISNADYRNGYGELSGGWNAAADSGLLAGARLDGLLGMRGDGYRLYGSRVPQQNRTVNRFRGDLALQSSVTDLVDYAAGVHLRGITMTDSIQSRETSLGFDFSAERQEGEFRLKGDASLWLDFYYAPVAVSNPYVLLLEMSGTYPLSDRVELDGGLAVSLFCGSDDDRKARVLPSFGLSWYPAERVTLFARFESSVERRTLGTLAEANPYIVNNVVIRHEERPVTLTGGGEVEISRGTRGRVSLDYSRVANYALFTADGDSGMWRPDYNGVTRVLALRCDVQAELAERHSLSGSLVLQGARNSVTGASPTYFPSVTLSGLYQYRFPFGLTAGGSVKVLGERSVDPANDRSTPAFALVDLTATYSLVSGLALTGTVQNLFNPSYSWWEGYEGRPRGVVVSLSHSW